MEEQKREEDPVVVHTVTTVPRYVGKTYWTINEFMKLPHQTGERMTSRNFYSYGQDGSNRGRCEGVTWWLGLCPRGGREEAKGYASLYLQGEGDLIKEGVNVTFRICVGQEKDGAELYDSGGQTTKFSNDNGTSGKGYPKVFAHTVTDANKEMLEGEMVITCTVEHVGKPITTGGKDDDTTPVAESLDGGALAMYRDGILTDVELSVDGRRYKTHKFVLAVKSPVFRQMFTSDFKESAAANCVIPVEDVSGEVCQMMLDHMYGEDLPAEVTMDQAEGLLHASEKYELRSLKVTAEDVLASNITKDTIAHLLLLSDRYNSGRLKRRCHCYIEDHWKEMKGMRNWDTIMLHHAHIMMERAGVSEDGERG